MFECYYKYFYSFYAPSVLIDGIPFFNSQMTKDHVISFFSRNSISLSKKQIEINKITNLLFQIKLKFKNEQKSILTKKILNNYKELLPPWIIFPNLFEGSPRWNQGFEEDYCMNYWLPFWKSLNNKERIDYCKNYKSPKEWNMWLKKNEKTL